MASPRERMDSTIEGMDSPREGVDSPTEGVDSPNEGKTTFSITSDGVWAAPSQIISSDEALASLVFTCVDIPCSAIERWRPFTFYIPSVQTCCCSIT